MPGTSYITSITNNIQIRSKLIMTYLLVVFLPVITVGLLLTHSLREQSVEHAVMQSTNNVEKIRKQIEETLKIPYDVSNTLYFDQQLKNIIDRQYESDLEVYNAYEGYDDFTNFQELYKEIAGIRFYAYNDTLLENWSIFKVSERIRSEAWFQETRANRGRVGWYYMQDPTRGEADYLSLSRQIFNKSMKPIGILVMTVHPGRLHSILSQEPFETMLVTEHSDIIVSTNPALTGQSLQRLGLRDSIRPGMTEPETASYMGEKVKIISRSIRLEYSDDSLSIVSVIPLESILEESKKVSYIAYAIIGASLILSTLLILYFSGMLSKRIHVLSRDLRKVAMGDLTLRSVVRGGDEVGQLSRHFNFMVSSIETLVRQLGEEQRQNHELQLNHNEMKFRMLVSQVNPHFLFNVLETVRMKAHCQNENEIANTLMALGNLLRHSLEIGRQPVPLQREMELVRMYLDIQQFRFGDRLSYSLPEEEEMEGIEILPMLLQPVVENAIVHGIESKLGKGQLDIKMIRESSHMTIQVSDNGGGIEPDRLAAVEASLNEADDRSEQRIGLRNVHHRIKLHYGSAYGIEITSKAGQGTRVVMRLPIRKGNEHVQASDY